MLLENELALYIADADPVTPGHSLVIPRRHGADGLALHQPEWCAMVELEVAAEWKVNSIWVPSKYATPIRTKTRDQAAIIIAP